MHTDQARRVILDLCRAQGFARAGICRAAPTDHREHVLQWIAEGRHGPMRYLETRLELRLDPAALIPGARSIICVADRYSDGRRDTLGRALRGRIARYARGGDYHITLRRRLESVRDVCRDRWPHERFRACVDTAPLLEREHAARAGLGAIGKHTLLIEPGVGSWMLLGAIVSTMDFDVAGSTAPAPRSIDGGATSQLDDPCGTCTRCIDACPTQCITPFSIDASACIATLTLEHRDTIDPSRHAAIGDWLAGCDVCQEVCPHAQSTRRSRRLPLQPEYAPRRDGFDVMEVIGWTEADRRSVVADSPLERLSLPMFRRNAIIVAGNTLPPERREEVVARLTGIAADPLEDPVVRTTARDVGDRLRATSGVAVHGATDRDVSHNAQRGDPSCS